MRRRDVIAAFGVVAIPIAGCSWSTNDRDASREPADAGGQQSGSTADGLIELEVAGAGAEGDLDAFEECRLHIDRWVAVEADGTRWPSGTLSTGIDLVDGTTTLEGIWVDIGDPHSFEAVELAVAGVTARTSSAGPVAVTVDSPERFPVEFTLDAVETVSLGLGLAPVRVDETDRYDLELVDRSVTTTPSI